MMLIAPLGSGLGAFIDALIAFLIVILICLPIHEFGHAWAAVRLGDSLPVYQGRYTLNPLRHLDVIGTALLALVGFGWAKPVQFNPYALRKAPNTRAGIFVVASAGPLMNVLLAVLAAIPFRLGLISVRDLASSQPLAVILYTLLSINLVLAVFNLIPVPPLDGSKILAMLLPAQYDNVMAMLSQYGMFILLFMILPVFGGQSAVSLIMSPIVSALTRLLLGF
jgi:Zn-dependent protease